VEAANRNLRHKKFTTAVVEISAGNKSLTHFCFQKYLYEIFRGESNEGRKECGGETQK